MELVPILSTIILVGTIATFILAVAAYILYKIREGRARDEGRPAAAIHQPEPHVLVAPQSHAVAVPTAGPSEAAMYAPPPQMQQRPPAPAQQPQQTGSFFWEYTDEGFVPVNPREEDSYSRQQHRAVEQDTAGYAWL